MYRFRKFLTLAAVLLVGAAVLGAPTQARADFKLYLQETGVNSGLATVVASGSDFGSIIFDGTYGDFKVSFFGATSENTTALSDIMSSTTKVENANLLSTGAHTLKLYVSQTNFSLPVGTPLAVESGMSSTITTGTLGLTGIYQGFADNGNALLGMGFTTGSQTAVLTGSTADTGSATGSFNRTTSTSLYSLTSLTTLDLSAGAKVNVSSHVNAAAVPVPAGLLLVVSGAPALLLLRRRMGKARKS